MFLPAADAQAFFARTRAYLFAQVPALQAQEIWSLALALTTFDERVQFLSYVVEDLQALAAGDRPTALASGARYRQPPVDIETFIKSPDYLNKADQIYPNLLAELIEINSGKYVEVVFTGGIGAGKTTGALYTVAYQLYLLSCVHDPHRLYGLDVASEIVFIFQSINARLAKQLDYARFKSMIDGCRYFREQFVYDRNIDSKLMFPHRIEVVPVSGAETAALGQNVIGGCIDELNAMAVVEKSRQAVEGGTYDQAVALYNSIARRRKSRFMSRGQLPGILCLVSSKKYPGQFTDQKEEEARTDPTIYIFDKRVWEIKPASEFTGEWFYVFTGDMARKPRILQLNEQVADADRVLVMRIPEEYRLEFEKDIINALREIAGVSTLARHPYFVENEKVDAAFGHHRSVLVQQTVDFVHTRLSIAPKWFVQPELPRFAHIDLAISGDSAGLVIGTVLRFVRLYDLGLSKSLTEMMPVFHIDAVLEVKPPRGGEIQFWKIRDTLTVLRQQGLNIRWVTFDSFQSTDSMQVLRQQGFVCGLVSMDTTNRPYDFLKSAIYDGRVRAPEHPLCRRELLSLERDTKKGRIDHPAAGSKDCADALAGVVYGLTMRREIWALHNVPLMAIPETVRAVPDRLEEKDERLRRSQQQIASEPISAAAES